MQLSQLKRFVKASSLLALVALMVVSLTPATRAQEFISINARFLNLPGGLGNNILTAPTGSIFPAGGNFVSDVAVGDYNGDSFQDIFVGSMTTDEVAVFLGRGNGSFVYTGSISLSGGLGTGVISSVINFATFGSFGPSTVAVAADYSAGVADAVHLIRIDLVGTIVDNLAVDDGLSGNIASVPSLVTNPVALAVGSTDAGGGTDLAVLCSGLNHGGIGGTQASSASAGWVGVFRGISTVTGVAGTGVQRIGGGIDTAAPVVLENAGTGTGTTVSGSLFDSRNNLGSTGLNINNDYDADDNGVTEVPANRRLFVVTPRTGYSNLLILTSPRAVTFGNSAHRDDGANDLIFVGVDSGSANTGIGIHNTTPAQGRQPEGSVFVLTNDVQAAGNMMRNARRLDEFYDYSNNTAIAGGPGQQNGVILPSGVLPSGVACADFNADNRLDLVSSNSGSTNCSFFNSGTRPEINFPGTPSVTTIQSYLTPTFVAIPGAPNTVYASDLTGDGRADAYGTSTGTNGGYLIAASSASPGTFALGSLLSVNGPPFVASPGTACRALAATCSAFNGLAGTTFSLNTFGTPVNFNGGIQDIVYARQGSALAPTTSGGVAVRYGSAQAATSYTASVIFLSSLVGVAEGRINGDTIPDVAICDRGADRVIVVLNSAGGFSSSSTVTTFLDLADFFPNVEAGGLSSLDIGDIDKNNTTDIVTTVDGPNDQVIVLYNIGGFSDIDARFTIRAFPIGGDPTAVKLADLAGPAGPGQVGATGKDGAPEIIAVNRRSNTVTTLINNGIGIFGQGRVAETGGFDPMSQTLGDYNDDGKIDTAVLNRGRRIPIGADFYEDESIVSILLGNGDGSFQASNFLIPVPRRAVSVVSAGYNVVRQAINIDVPDINGDGLTDLAVVAETGGGPTDDVFDSFGSNDAPTLTVLLGSSTQPGQFVRSTSFQRLVDSMGTTSSGPGRIAVYPGAFDVRDGRRIGYGVLAVNGDYNQNGRVDAQAGGVEFNNGFVPSGVLPTFFALESGFASAITALDNLNQAFGAPRQFNVFPSSTNNSNTVFARLPVDADAVTGLVAASSYVVSNTGAIVGQDVNDFSYGNGNIAPDVVQVTLIGRAYVSHNASSILNHAPLVTTSRGNADFTDYNRYGRKVILDEGAEVKLTLRTADVDPSAPGALRFRLVDFPNFVSMVDNNNGTAVVTIKPGLTDGSATANNGLGQAYQFTAETTDNDFRLPLTGVVHFRIFVKDKPTAPTIAPIPDASMFVTQTLTVPVTATSLTNRTIRLSTDFTAPFATFTDAGGGAATFRFNPTLDSQAGKYNVTVRATDDLGLTSTASFALTVIANTSPVIGTVANVTMTEGETRTVAIKVTDPDITGLGQRITISLSGPGFAIFNATGNGEGSILLEPRVAADKGTYTITINARDNGIPEKTAAPVSFTVTVNPAVRITAASYAKKRLFISGVGFGTSPTVTVNGVALAASKIVPGSTDTSITAKGANKKDLNLRKGSNTVQVTGTGGQRSNTFTVNLAAEELED